MSAWSLVPVFEGLMGIGIAASLSDALGLISGGWSTGAFQPTFWILSLACSLV
jgi:hypothetical protein